MVAKNIYSSILFVVIVVQKYTIFQAGQVNVQTQVHKQTQ